MNYKLLGAAILAMATLLVTPAWAQETPAVDRTATGGAQTLEDILRRQERLELNDSFRSENLGDVSNAAPITETLGVEGGV